MKIHQIDLKVYDDNISSDEVKELLEEALAPYMDYTNSTGKCFMASVENVKEK